MMAVIVDERDPEEWADGFRPQSVEIEHDSLYRVVSAMFHYSTPEGDDEDDVGTDWRDHANGVGEATGPNDVDPMRPEPAPMVIETPKEGKGVALDCRNLRRLVGMIGSG